MVSTSFVLGLDFGTTNTVAAVSRNGEATLIPLATPGGTSEPVFRSALCFWQDDDAPGGVAVEGGPWAIAEYLADPGSTRFIQSFKSVAASAAFEHASVLGRRYRFEELGRLFLTAMAARAGGLLSGSAARVVVGRPVTYAGHRPDEVRARERYGAMMARLGTEIHYVYEPVGAAFSYAARITEPATILVADFGGGTSDFSVMRLGAPGATQRCRPLGHAGVGIAGDRFDYRLMDHLVLPLLGKGGRYRSFHKDLEIPGGWYTDFGDWSRLALMRNKRTLAELETLRRTAHDASAIARMIAVIECEQGYALYEAIGAVKRALSSAEAATFSFTGSGLTIEAEVEREAFEAWIAPDIARIEAAVDRALDASGIAPARIDRVFLTGGTSFTPRLRRLFAERFGEDRLASGDELTAVAHGLALIGEHDDIAAWSV